MKAYDFQAKTNVAPLIDVSLIIVLALMVMAPKLNPATKGVDLPQANASESRDDERLEITCLLSGEVRLGDDVVGLEQLGERVEDYFKANPHAVAVIKADQALAYGAVEKVIAAVEAAHAPRVAIATREHDAQPAGKGSPGR